MARPECGMGPWYRFVRSWQDLNVEWDRPLQLIAFLLTNDKQLNICVSLYSFKCTVSVDCIISVANPLGIFCSGTRL